jgi:hypothetical protein
MDPMWNNYNKLLVILDKLLAIILIYLMGTEYQEFELSFCAPQANEHGHSTIVQNIESLKISQALNSFNFEWMLVNSKKSNSQILQIWALNLSSSVKSGLKIIYTNVEEKEGLITHLSLCTDRTTNWPKF